MAFEPQLQNDEELLHDLALVISKKLSLRLVLTSKAAYWPGTKLAITDGVTTEMVSVGELKNVFVGKKSALGSMLVGALMIVGGVLWTLAGYVGAPQALVIGGLIVAVVGGQRRTIAIHGPKKKFTWKEPISFGGGIKDQVTEVVTAVERWAERVGAPRS